MDFNLTEERQMLQDSLRRFLRDKYDTETRNKIIDSETGFSGEIWQEMAELGVIGALFSEDDGGFGGAGFDIATVFEELGRAGVVEPILDTALLAGGLIAEIGNDTQKGMVEQIIAGEIHLALAHGEPGSRYDLSRVTTTASEVDGTIVLNGRKSVVSNGGTAGHLIVSARETGDAQDPDGISLFLVPPDTQGLLITSSQLIGGGHSAEIILDDVHIPAEARLGPKGKAFPALEHQVSRATVALCAEALGAMETAMALTIEYLGQRKQFGRPIGSFQALQHRTADLLIELEQARSITILAAGHLQDARDIRERHVSAAKHLIGRIGRQISEESIQMHGGIAMTQEYALAHFAKRIVMIDHKLGDTDHHMERFIALGAA
ncbi:acyl-CoA dehydrogenase family protein [Litoreibacter roseus]|uniref:Acyl-CoA dehydrogenase n=1 Tax=Litoreibacter roseus TaxID=2601869 RepID=A0A6N6JH78_9RHOB|nr:acyl-CoA dehydrogenase [Litoreibacter roseus]GFE65586.1 acyl-CoA dehydrogenase [Litoreibacter roseus]